MSSVLRHREGWKMTSQNQRLVFTHQSGVILFDNNTTRGRSEQNLESRMKRVEDAVKTGVSFADLNTFKDHARCVVDNKTAKALNKMHVNSKKAQVHQSQQTTTIKYSTSGKLAHFTFDPAVWKLITGKSRPAPLLFEPKSDGTITIKPVQNVYADIPTDAKKYSTHAVSRGIRSTPAIAFLKQSGADWPESAITDIEMVVYDGYAVIKPNTIAPQPKYSSYTSKEKEIGTTGSLNISQETLPKTSSTKTVSVTVTKPKAATKPVVLATPNVSSTASQEASVGVKQKTLTLPTKPAEPAPSPQKTTLENTMSELTALRDMVNSMIKLHNVTLFIKNDGSLGMRFEI